MKLIDFQFSIILQNCRVCFRGRNKSQFIISLLLLLSRILICQNLVQNGGFEIHEKPKCLGCVPQDKFSSHVRGWNNIGWLSQLFTTEYQFTKQETDWGYKSSDYSPHTGNAAVLLRANLRPSSGYNLGGSSYVFSKLYSPLAIGRYYKVQFWVYIVSKTTNGQGKETLSILKKIGVSLSDKIPKVIDNVFNLSPSDTPFTLNTIDIGHWVSVEYTIHVTDGLNFINIGWFNNPKNPLNLPDLGVSEFEFLVDDITITSIENPFRADSLSAIDYPFLVKPNKEDKQTITENSFEEPITIDTLVSFDHGSYSLNNESKKIIDNVAKIIKKEKIEICYTIEGFTDNTGTSQINDKLSIERAQEVIKYFNEAHNLPVWRFKLLAFGESDPIATNNTLSGQMLNRRVRISKSNILASTNLYRMASESTLAKKNEEAFEYLKIWLKLKETDKILLLFDPELEPLHESSQWKAVKYLIKNSYQSYTNPNLAFELDFLYCKDQLFRTLAFDYDNAKGYMPDFFDFGLDEAAKIYQDSSETLIPQIVNIIDKNGWPSKKEVGERAVTVPAMVLLHSRNIQIQKRFLPILEKACREGKIENRWYATLFDLIMEQEQGVQRYGTRRIPSNDNPRKMILAPIENIEKINQYRKEIGMPVIDLSRDNSIIINEHPSKKRKL